MYGHVPGLIEQAYLLLKKCDGLPLAISTIGSFLATKPKTATEWRNFNKHISDELEKNPDLGMIKTVLLSCYDGLPYHLKSCFLYLAIFPEDHKIRWARLVRRWIAEGYSRRIHDRILEVHDLIRETGLSKATEENLVFTLEEGCDLNIQGKIRHLAVSSSWTRDKDAFESALDLSHLRSLTVFGGLKAFFISDKMRLLRVLDLEDTEGLTDQHLHQIGKLCHLNYLSLRGCNENLRLPDSLGNLRHLQTLDVRGIRMIQLPRTITKLAKLQYLRVGFVKWDDSKDSRDWVYTEHMSFAQLHIRFNCIGCCCCWPVYLLVGICYLLFLLGRFLCVLTRDSFAGVPVFFMQLDPYGVKFPTGIQKLKSLHTVGVVNIDGENSILKELRDITKLRKLRVNGLNKENCRNFCSAVANLRSLKSLSVRSEGDPSLSGCLDSLSAPPDNLQSLKLYGNLVKLPEWIKKLRYLVKMELRSSSISEAEVGATLQVLGKLQNLAILRLQKGAFEGQELCFSFHQEAFSSLRVLALVLLGSMKSVKFEGTTATNKLVLLRLEFPRSSSPCKPGVFSGLPSLPSLKEVVVSYSSKDLMEDLRAQLARNPNQPILKI